MQIYQKNEKMNLKKYLYSGLYCDGKISFDNQISMILQMLIYSMNFFKLKN